MSIRNNLCLGALAILSVACSSNKIADSNEGKEIIFSQGVSEVSENDLQISFYHPEETEGSLIGDISVVCQYKNAVYIGDDKSGRLLKYDKTGKLMSVIGSKGQGAGEYVDFSYFFLAPEEGLVGILDEDRQKVLYYGLSDNQFKKSRDYRDVVSNCCVPFNGGLLWYNQNYEGSYDDKYFVYTDSQGAISDSFVNKSFITGYFTGSSCPLFSADGRVYGYTPYDMKLYEFSDGKVNVKYDIDIEGFESPTVDFLNKISDGGSSVSLFSELSKSHYISYYSIGMCSSLMIVKVIRNKEHFIGLLDRTSGKTSFMPLPDFAKKTGVGKISYFIQNTIDDSVLCVIEKDAVTDYIEETGAKVDERLMKLIESDNENPIIMKIRMNK